MDKGLGTPNREWEVYTKQEEEAVLDLSPTGILLLGYPDSPVLLDKTLQERYLIERLGNNPRVLLRPYVQNALDINPRRWARECYRLVSIHQSHGTTVELIPANELNIEGGGEEWGRQAQWLIEFVVEYRTLDSTTRLHVPALSPSGNYRDGYEFYAQCGLHLLYDVSDLHCYNEGQLGDVPWLYSIYETPICVTEINQMSPAFYIPYLSRYPYVEGVYWFILYWNNPQPEFPNVNLLDGPYYYDFKHTIVPVVDTKNNTKSGNESSGEVTLPPKESRMTQEEVWEYLKTPYNTFPSLTKPIVAYGGITVGPETEIDEYTYQFGIIPGSGGNPQHIVTYAITGDWGNVKLAFSPGELPDPH